jgi:hypothetical protein
MKIVNPNFVFKFLCGTAWGICIKKCVNFETQFNNIHEIQYKMRVEGDLPSYRLSQPLLRHSSEGHLFMSVPQICAGANLVCH